MNIVKLDKMRVTVNSVIGLLSGRRCGVELMLPVTDGNVHLLFGDRQVLDMIIIVSLHTPCIVSAVLANVPYCITWKLIVAFSNSIISFLSSTSRYQLPLVASRVSPQVTLDSGACHGLKLPRSREQSMWGLGDTS